jgi:hypothetical protein
MPQLPPGLVHLLQAIGGKLQGALGTAETAQQNMDKNIGKTEDAGKQAILQALSKLLNGANNAPNPVNSDIGNAALGGAEKALDNPAGVK